MTAERSGRDYAFWQRPEMRIVRRHVVALVEGRCRRLQDAVEACKAELDRQRKLKPDDGWPSRPRQASAVRWKLKKEARRAGWQSLRVHWSPEEQAALDRHVTGLLDGLFYGPKQAARACLFELQGIAKKQRSEGGRPVRRSLMGVRDRILVRARELGWSSAQTRWLPEERLVLDRHVRRLVRSPGLKLRTAVLDFSRDLRRLHDRLSREKPDRFRRVIPRPDATLKGILGRRAVGLGRPLPDAWQPDEDKVIRRFARAVLDARHSDVEAAARACRRALGRLRRGWRTTDPARFRRTAPRTVIATRNRLLELTHSFGERWPKSGWTPAELKACRRWVRWYMACRTRRGLRTWNAAAEGLCEELDQLRSRRTVGACGSQMWEQRRSMYGAA